MPEMYTPHDQMALRPVKQINSVQPQKQTQDPKMTFSPKPVPKGDPSFAKWGLEEPEEQEQELPPKVSDITQDLDENQGEKESNA